MYWDICTQMYQLERYIKREKKRKNALPNLFRMLNASKDFCNRKKRIWKIVASLLVLLEVLLLGQLVGNKSDQSSSDTATVLSDTDANALLAVLADALNLLESFSDVLLEAGVELNERAIDTDIDHLILVDGCVVSSGDILG